MAWRAGLIWGGLALGLGGQIISAPGPQQKLLRAAAQNELRFLRARGNYTYHRHFSFFEVSNQQHQPGGFYREVADLTFTPGGQRYKRYISGPFDTLKFLILHRRNMSDLRQILPLVLTPTKLEGYFCRYIGAATIRLRDGNGRWQGRIATQEFRISPLQTWPGQRYFHGEVWLDPRTLGVVKLSGYPVPNVLTYKHGRAGRHLFEHFTTWFQRLDHRYWFPVYTYGRDWLNFPQGAVLVREKVRYTHYQRFVVQHKIEMLPMPVKPQH